MAVRDEKRPILMDAILRSEKKARAQHSSRKISRFFNAPRGLFLWMVDHLGWIIPSFIVTVAAYVFVSALNNGDLSLSYMWGKISDFVQRVIG